MEALYQIGDTITSHLNISGIILNRVFNEASREWVYFCENMSIKESNIKKKTNVRTTKQRNKK